MMGTGGAYAADTVFSSDIKDGEVRTQDLADQAVTNTKLAFDAVTGSRIRNGAIESADVGDHQIAARNVGIDSVTGSKVFDDAIKGADVEEATLAPVPDALKLGGLPPSTFLQDATGTVDGDNIAGEAVTGADLATGAILANRVQDDTLTGADVDESSLGTVENTARLGGEFLNDFYRARHDGGSGPANGQARFSSARVLPPRSGETAVASVDVPNGPTGELRVACDVSPELVFRYVNTGPTTTEVWVDAGSGDPQVFDVAPGAASPQVSTSGTIDFQTWRATRRVSPPAGAPGFEAFVFTGPGGEHFCTVDIQTVLRG